MFFIISKKPAARPRGGRQTHLVAPEELVSVPVLETIPDVQELRDSVSPDVIGILLGLVPGERSSEIEEAHCDWVGSPPEKDGVADTGVRPRPERLDIALGGARDDKHSSRFPARA